MTFANSNPSHDPFVIGIDHPLEVRVGEKARGHIRAQGADFGAYRFAQ